MQEEPPPPPPAAVIDEKIEVPPLVPFPLGGEALPTPPLPTVIG